MPYADAIQFLCGLQMFGANFGLETTRKLAASACNPQDKLRFIHVAGTNGKGSTCAFLESIYRAAGYRVGLYTSPHLVSFRERIQVNRQLISEEVVVRLVGELQELLHGAWTLGLVGTSSTSSLTTTLPRDAVERVPTDHNPTFFEFVTVMALRYFAEQNCDLVIWETGLGGRLDATNIVTPMVSVITNIGFDHQQWLGDTLAKIAAEKAGIIKPGVPVITATEALEALAVIEAKAHELAAPLTIARPFPLSLLPAHLPLLGVHQRVNATLALATVNALRNQLPVCDEAIRRGLETVSWPGRLQVVKRGGQTLLLDGAHNPDGAGVLNTSVKELFPDFPPALVLGMMADKDCATICQTLAPLAQRICLVPLASERSANPADLLPLCWSANPRANTTCHDSLEDALEHVAGASFIIITGSLYLVGEALELLGLSPDCAADERALNDWTAKK